LAAPQLIAATAYGNAAHLAAAHVKM